MKTLEGREEALNREMAVTRERGEALRTDLEQQEKTLTEQKIRLASLEEKREADLKTLTRLEISLTDHTREIEAKTRDAEACDREAQTLAAQIASDEEKR